MNQNIIFDLQETVDTVATLGLFVSLCSIERRPNPPGTDASGWPDYSVSPTGYQPVAGLTNIPCMNAVEATAKPDKYGVVRTAMELETMAYYHILLNGYYPTILQRDLAIVDGTTYMVQAVESDSQGVMTRLAVRRWAL